MTVTNDAPNRNRGSIRSILTLPTYHPSPRADEQLIAREGERAGVDTVVEYPETQDEEEARREADMAALYEIRQVRRREIEERNERRAARAEARENRDWPRLEQLRLEGVARQQARAQAERERTGSVSGSSLTLLPTVSSSAMPEQGIGGNYNSSTHPHSNNNSSQSLIAEHNARTASRDRRISSVSYADLGLARHDGSRLRENSVDSDHRPLLEGAAIMGSGPAGHGGVGSSGSNDNSRRGSLFNTNTSIFRNSDGRLPLHQHHRATSAESVVTTESEYAGAAAAAAAGMTTTGRGSGSGPAMITTPQTSSSSSSAAGQQGPTVESSSPPPPAPMIGEEPPQYEDAPPYTSPIADRGEGPLHDTSMSLPLSLPATLSMDMNMGMDISTPTPKPAPRLDRANSNVVPAIQVSDSSSASPSSSGIR